MVSWIFNVRVAHINQIFTLVASVIVTTIIGILAAAAITRYAAGPSEKTLRGEPGFAVAAISRPRAAALEMTEIEVVMRCGNSATAVRPATG